MQEATLRFGHGYRVVAQVRKAQAAEMVHAPGEAEGGGDNYHRGSDQWLYVISGSGTATVDATRIALKRGALLVIERRENHEIRNTGRTPLKTLNFYYPPAFTKGGNPEGPGRKLPVSGR